MVRKITTFLGTRIWNMKVSEQPLIKAVPLTALRVLTLTGRFFFVNKCPLRASALTFYTLLSIVPVLALMFGIAKGLGFDEMLRKQIEFHLASQPEVSARLLEFSEKMLINAKGGIVAGFGALFLIWAALKLLSNVENSFNEIWGIKHGRSIVRKISDYLTMLVVFPIMMILVTGASAFAAVELNGMVTELPFPQTANYIIELSARFVPFLASWVIFAFIYILIPNTKVKLKSGIVAGIFTGTCYLVLQYLYVFAQVYLTTYNAVYGTFAVVPFFLIWLQLTWTLVLLGAQLSFAIQNVNIYEFSMDNGPLSAQMTSIYALRIVRELAICFEKHRPGMSDAELSRTLEIPVRITRRILYELEQAGVISALQTDKNAEARFQVAVPTGELTPVFVMRSLAGIGGGMTLMTSGRDYDALLDHFWASAARASENVPLSRL